MVEQYALTSHVVRWLLGMPEGTVNRVCKVFAMIGWPIGYADASPHFAKAMAKIQSQSTSGACSILQARSPIPWPCHPSTTPHTRPLVSLISASSTQTMRIANVILAYNIVLLTTCLLHWNQCMR